ncbi:MAG: hypothetical protein IOC64_13300 [Methylobacterium sp.]|jgi:hypothetical protein|nr:hypothetical protein [Methylobacterium sp.]MCA3600905.1 hypothetical protein [Methylobacterium sp.]MCA3611598.1 hypothetical protein [Methylobacterium sp.]MCA3624540.1 hypothetical protein [Methylobacterium sp.]MCA3628414.1 hypothetical protein [Methylobacterium sp.]
MDFEFHPARQSAHSAIVYQSFSEPRRFIAAPAFPEGIIPVTMPLPRPGHFAEREELDDALQRGMAEALREFLERHPTSRYRPEAEEALRKFNNPPPSTR